MTKRLLLAAYIIAASLAAGCASIVTLPHSKGSDNASRKVDILFKIKVPSTSPTTSLHHRAYVSTSTQSATVAVSAPGQTTASYTFGCTSQSCQEMLAVAPGTWTFAVTLFSGPGGSGSVLSEGVTANKTIVAGSANSVSVTFNPVVAYVQVNVNPAVIPDAIPTAATVQLIAEDATHAEIIGPGSFLNASGAQFPLVLTIANSAAFTTGALSFSSPAPAASVSFDAPPTPPASNAVSTQIYYNGSTIGLISPILKVSQNGSPVPIDSAGGQPWLIVQPPTPTSTTPGNSNYLSHVSIVYAPNSSGSPTPFIYYCNSGCFVNSTPINTTPISPGLFSETAVDGSSNLWFFDPDSGNYGYTNTETSTLAFNFPVCAQSEPNLMSTGTDGHVWYSGVSNSGVPTVGYLAAPTACPTPATVGTNPGSTITGLVGGPSQVTYMTVTSGSQSQLWKTKSSLNPTLVGSSTIPFAVAALGYSTYDGNLYVQSQTTNDIYALNPSTGEVASTPLCAPSSSLTLPQLTDSHHTFTLLLDGTLGYIGDNGGASQYFVRIVPGVGCYSFIGIVTDDTNYYLFGMSSDGLQGTVSNGGNIAHISF